jgi:hypothetical protein
MPTRNPAVPRQPPMTLFYLSLILLCGMACKKTNIDTSPESILMNHEWYRYQVHYISVDTTNHITEHDTTYLTSACEQQEYFKLLAHDSASCLATCEMATPTALSGTWGLMSDSSFSVLVPYHTPAGVAPSYLGFDLSKLREIDNAHFVCLWNRRLYYLTDGNITVHDVSYYFSFRARQ